MLVVFQNSLTFLQNQVPELCWILCPESIFEDNWQQLGQGWPRHIAFQKVQRTGDKRSQVGDEWPWAGQVTSPSLTLCFLFNCEVWLIPAAGPELLKGQCRHLRGVGGAGGEGGHSASEQRKPAHRTKCCCSRSGDEGLDRCALFLSS